MKKNLIIVLAAFFFITGCFKDDVHKNNDADAVIAIFDGGQSNLANASLDLTTPDSVTVYPYAGVATPYTLNKDANISIVVDDAARVAYNQQHGTNYEALPDSLYVMVDSAGLLTAGARGISLQVKIYSGKADLRRSYMLPIAIKAADGHNISADSGIIYFNNLGSPIAGRYKVTGTRTNYTGPVSDGIVSEIIDLSTLPAQVTTTAAADSVLLGYSDLNVAGWQYIIKYNSSTQTISIAPNAVMLNQETGYLEGSFKIDIQEYNAATRTFHLKTEYSDLGSNARVIDEYLTAQ